jgi:hypothetical protein
VSGWNIRLGICWTARAILFCWTVHWKNFTLFGWWRCIWINNFYGSIPSIVRLLGITHWMLEGFHSLQTTRDYYWTTCWNRCTFCFNHIMTFVMIFHTANNCI